MQRAAASAPPHSPSNSNSGPPTPSSSHSHQYPSPKRQKLDPDISPSTATPNTDLQAIQAALAAEEAKREQALERQAKEAGETKWFLSFRPEESVAAGRGLKVARAGFAGIDQEGGSIGTEEGLLRAGGGDIVGRRSFGKFNRVLEVSFLRSALKGDVSVVEKTAEMGTACRGK